MKFAQVLQETQTPEWKRAYINYRGLKKKINEVTKDEQGLETITESPRNSEDPLPAINQPSRSQHPPSSSRPVPRTQKTDSSVRTYLGDSDAADEEDEEDDEAESDTPARKKPKSQVPAAKTKPSAVATPQEEGSAPCPSIQPAFSHFRQRSNGHRKATAPFSIRLGRAPTFEVTNNISTDPPALRELIPLLTPMEKSFFDMLDAELEKVDSFYLDREKEFRTRGDSLREQLQELAEHRKLFYAAHPSSSNDTWTNSLKKSFFNVRSRMPTTANERNKHREGKNGKVKAVAETEAGEESLQRGGSDQGSSDETTATTAVGHTSKSNGKKPSRESDNDQGAHGSDWAHRYFGSLGLKLGEESSEHHNPRTLDPEDYMHAKKKLKKAVLEHYRGLEMLNNYRIMNLTGFRKALKKFEKMTKIPCAHAYMTEKVEKYAFASGDTIDEMTQEMEALFTARFERGNKKRAMARLRAAAKHKTHHFSTFRSGFMLGLAVPALVSGLYQSFQPETRAAIPGWDVLLYMYGILVIPIFFALLVGLNIAVWSTSRINYAFIFDLDARTRLDTREFFEIPATLAAALCYAFWLSFSRIGASHVEPSLWLPIWLGFTAVVMFNPLPIFFLRSRWWLIKSIGKLLFSGTRRVDFADFWMGDQFCSLTFTLSNLFFIPCAYTDGLPGSFTRCSVGGKFWPLAYTLALLPLLIRLVQSIKRYVDSKLVTHLINGGKYFFGIIYLFSYFIWRHHKLKHDGTFAAVIFFGTLYSLYASAWDYLMDWSVFKRHSKYPLLRPDLLYSNHVYFYYFAIVSNILIRFIWVFYLPVAGPVIQLRTFIAGILEALRRWQWNFYRLENEHLGNMDQYRVTREIPLPYQLDDVDDEDHSAEEEKRSRRFSKYNDSSSHALGQLKLT